MLDPGFRPKKSFGQNFLHNPRVVERIIREARLTGSELVVEVGPGFGILTEALLQTGCRVMAIEKDRALFEELRGRFRDESNLELILGDALRFPPPREPYVWVANIPYSITSPLLDHFIRDASPNLPQRAVLMVQKEVAEKLCAKPPHMNVLALHVQAFGTPKIVLRVSRGNFKPAPKVDSAVIVIEFPKIPAPGADDKEAMFTLIHRAFSHKRKMLRATLQPEMLERAGIDPRRRPETITLEEWEKLAA